MRTLTLLASLLVCIPLAFGQKRKGKEDNATLVDSLTQANALLTAQLDSVNRLFGSKTFELDSVTSMLSEHRVMYDAIKEKVMHGDFQPLRTAELIDSLKTTRDGSAASASAGLLAMRDTLTMLQEENAGLKASVAAWESRGISDDQAVDRLEQLKMLLDHKILTPEEFDIRKRKILMKWK
jgi:hypothetical protein